MIYSILKEAGLDPTVLCGAEMDGTDGLRIGEGDTLIYESCEYKDAFLYMPPRVQVFTSLELDHTDYFKDIEALKSSFLRAAEAAKDALILNSDDKNLSEIAKNLNKRVISYGIGEDTLCRYRYIGVSEWGTDVEIDRAIFTLGSLGRHNASNAAAAYATASYLGIDREYIIKALGSFKGVGER